MFYMSEEDNTTFYYRPLILALNSISITSSYDINLKRFGIHLKHLTTNIYDNRSNTKENFNK